MESNFSDLPPLKRYRMMQKYQQQHEENNLPAKKRKSSRDSPPQLSIPAADSSFFRESPPQPSVVTAAFCKDSAPQAPVPAADTTFCLPAKKRVLAFQPLDLNRDYEPEIPSDVSQSSPGTEIQAGENNGGGENPGSEDPQTTEIGDDDGVVCAICESTDGEETDPIVFCDGCDLMVHASCYGHPFSNGIPKGEWFCKQCIYSKSTRNSAQKTEISCCLCPVSGGALKPTTDGRWAHLVCAIYVPEAFFEDSESREGINCTKVVKRRWERKCYLCKSRSGCVLDCSEPKCPLAFHVTCGLKEDLCIEFRQRRNRGGVVAAFCRAHTDIWNKQENTGKFKIVGTDEMGK